MAYNGGILLNHRMFYRTIPWEVVRLRRIDPVTTDSERMRAFCSYAIPSLDIIKKGEDIVCTIGNNRLIYTLVYMETVRS